MGAMILPRKRLLALATTVLMIKSLMDKHQSGDISSLLFILISPNLGLSWHEATSLENQ